MKIKIKKFWVHFFSWVSGRFPWAVSSKNFLAPLSLCATIRSNCMYGCVCMHSCSSEREAEFPILRQFRSLPAQPRYLSATVVTITPIEGFIGICNGLCAPRIFSASLVWLVLCNIAKINSQLRWPFPLP